LSGNSIGNRIERGKMRQAPEKKKSIKDQMHFEKGKKNFI
jgi:hypothetical protein